MAELNKWICEATGRNRPLALIPDPIGKAMARVTGWLPGAPMTWDQWLMMQTRQCRHGPRLRGLRPPPRPARRGGGEPG